MLPTKRFGVWLGGLSGMQDLCPGQSPDIPRKNVQKRDIFVFPLVFMRNRIL